MNVDTFIAVEWDSSVVFDWFYFDWWNVLAWTTNHPTVTGFAVGAIVVKVLMSLKNEPEIVREHHDWNRALDLFTRMRKEGIFTTAENLLAKLIDLLIVDIIFNDAINFTGANSGS